ncbi:MAG TPA: hypothetical protein VKB79_27525 [Bryobacteraceae bacterium]|nr:hypothetical protein [Bryobacteraceae bacterium]
MAVFSSQDGTPAVTGTNTDGGFGLSGISNTNHAVHGESQAGRGVVGVSGTFVGVTGESTTGTGVFGTSTSGIGVDGRCTGNNHGVQGISDTAHGVHGESRTNHAVHGESAAGRGVVGISQTFVGVTGESTSSDGVFGTSVSGVGVHGQGGQLAGLFEGDIKVTGQVQCPTSTIHCLDLNVLNGDCAEEFDLSGAGVIEPGTLMSLGSDGYLLPSSEAYDGRVAGVISGAGEYKPGIVLDKRHSGNRVPIALLGKVYCKVDAEYAAIEVGDLLTTSSTVGHAMKATDPMKAFGAVIGKALGAKSEGRGMIPVLVALR